MIFDAVSRAIAQMPDPRFRGVLLRGIGITLGALIAAVVVVFNVVGWMVGDAVTLPWIGTVQWLDDAASWASVPVMLLLSVFLMTPVASAIISMFLEEVAQAVEDRHYPGLPAATPVSFSDGLDRTIRWYFDTYDRDDIAGDFEASLTGRGFEKAGRKTESAARA